jgi:hypothetical protein
LKTIGRFLYRIPDSKKRPERVVGMKERNTKVDRLSKNYRELDNDGKEKLLRIGEKVFTVKDFINKEISSLLNERNEIGKLGNENS